MPPVMPSKWPLGQNHPAPRRLRTLALAALLSLFVLPAMAAQADTPSTLTVVGTSDVQDSGLVPNLIKPMFEKAFPAFTLNYVSVGTGVAISDAESGVASALIVHAASLENQFVAQGFSAEPFGRAVFYGDYVLLGPASDPAGVLTNAPNDIAGAFARIAAAGAAGKADFVSRGGTPGTTVQEHAIWALDAGTPGLNLCDVSSTNGGGAAPSTASGPCPTTASNPSWYHTTGLTQAPNIEAANTCSFAGGNDCYVITDRGTYECLLSPSCSSGQAAPTNLKIVTQNNSATATGGSTLLVNSFHAYAINPAKFAGNPNVQINSTAAEDFLNFITQLSFQAQLKSYLAAGTTVGPFIADAAPTVTVSNKLPKKVKGGQKVTIRGTVVNLVPGTPALAEPVTVSEVGSGLAAGVPVASGKTSSTGAYSITFSPPSTGSYQVSTGKISQIENSTLSPVFGDLLQPGASTAAKISVHGVVEGLLVKGRPGQLLVTGSVLPGSVHAKASVDVLARNGRHGAFKKIATSKLGSGDGGFAIGVPRKPATWYVKVRFQDPGQVLSTTTPAEKVVVPARSAASVSTGSVKIRNGKLTIKGTVGPKPVKGGTTVQLLAVDVGALRAGTAATGGSVHFRTVAKVKLRVGVEKFTVSAKLERGRHWILQLEYVAGASAGTAYGLPRGVRVT